MTVNVSTLFAQPFRLWGMWKLYRVEIPSRVESTYVRLQGH